MTTNAGASSRVFSAETASPGLLGAAQRLLGYIDDLPAGATGALHFADEGLILLESRKICWAVVRSMRTRLTDILREQSATPVSREQVERIYRACRERGTPIGEALVASGLASEAGLRAALAKHSSEAIVALAHGGLSPSDFVQHTKTGYDPKFSFSPCEVLATLGSFDDSSRAAAAQLELEDMLVEDSVGAAFARSNAASGPRLIAVSRGCDFAVADLIGVCNWTSGLFDLARTVDSEVFAARANWPGSAGLVAWRSEDVGYLGLCSSRAAAARLVSRLSERAFRGSGVVLRGERAGKGPA